MTERLFVCHAKLDIESTNEVIDGLETALDFASGSLLSSSLPGYSSDARSEAELRAVLAGTGTVLAVITDTSVEDPEFSFELGAAWALGIDIIPVLFGTTQPSALPWPVRSNDAVRIQQPGAWEALVSKLSQRLGVQPRRTARPAAPEVASASVSGFAPAGDTVVDDFVPPPVGDPADEAVTQTRETAEALASIASLPDDMLDQAQLTAARSEPAPAAEAAPFDSSEPTDAFQPPPPAGLRAAPEASLLPPEEVTAVPPLGAAYPPEPSFSAPPEIESAPADSYKPAAEARYLAEEVSEASALDAVTSPVIQLDAAPVSVAPLASRSPSEAAATSLRPSATTSAVFARLPSCEMSLEAGRAVSDCLFNRAEITDFESELAKPLGTFVEAMGGSWDELRKLHDFDIWMSVTENLIDKLPPELRRVDNWYQLGFELATLHNLAGQLVLDGPDRTDSAEQTWRGALERFLVRAENVQIGYEKVGRVLSLLENLAGPRAQRDLSNISRSLEEVRRFAAGADGIHTAA